MSTRPVESFHSFVVPHPIGVARRFLMDFGHAPLWDPATLRSDPIDGGPVGARSEWTTRSVVAGRASTGRYRLDWSTPYGIVLTGRHPGLTRTVEFALVDLGEHTEVHLTMRYYPRGFAWARHRRQRDDLVELTGLAAVGLANALEAHAGGDRAAEVAPAGMPSHVVDHWYLGWRLAWVDDDTATGWRYRAHPTGPRDPRTYRDLAMTRGPLRQVVAPSAADIHEIDQLLAEAGDRAMATIAAAVHAVHARLRDAHDHAHLDAAARDGLARQRLTAASEGTPPAVGLFALLVQPEPAIAAVAPAARDALARMITGWVGHRERYTDPAVALVTVVPPRLMPGPMRHARRAWIRTDPTLSLAADADPNCDGPESRGGLQRP